VWLGDQYLSLFILIQYKETSLVGKVTLSRCFDVFAGLESSQLKISDEMESEVAEATEKVPVAPVGRSPTSEDCQCLK
jgi:hypothetical protein